MTFAEPTNQGMDPNPRMMWSPSNLDEKQMEKFREFVNQKHSLALGKNQRENLFPLQWPELIQDSLIS